MAKSSINFQKAAAHSSAHNLRQDEANYLLPKEYRKENEYWRHEKSDQEIFLEELGKAKRRGGRVPKLENSRWEAVVNLNAGHTLKDVQRVAAHIAEKFNLIATEIAIHRDEGRVERGTPIYNLHAHLNFVTYKDGRQNWRRNKIKPKDLRELQTEVADLLAMERGKKGSEAVRLSHKQYKKTAKTAAKQADLKREIDELRSQLKEQGAEREKYAELEAANKLLREKIKSRELTEAQLREEVAKLRNGFAEIITNKNETIKKQKTAIEALEAQKAIQGTAIRQKDAQIASYALEINKKDRLIDELRTENLNLFNEAGEKEGIINELVEEIEEKDAKISKLETALGKAAAVFVKFRALLGWGNLSEQETLKKLDEALEAKPKQIKRRSYEDEELDGLHRKR